MSRSRGWCFTINNPKEECYMKCMEIPSQYIVIGTEYGEENKTKHIQGYMYFSNAISFESAKEYVFTYKANHVEAQKGTNKQASDYCTEDGDWFDFGELPKQGRRTDVENIYDMCRLGLSKRAILEEMPQAMRMLKAIDEVSSLYNNNDKCQLYHYKGTQKLTDYCLKEYKNPLFICNLEELALYDDSYDVVCMMDVFYHKHALNMLLHNIPLNVKYGYQIKRILPKELIFQSHEEHIGVQEIHDMDIDIDNLAGNNF